jgi:hypothetical protein
MTGHITQCFDDAANARQSVGTHKIAPVDDAGNRSSPYASFAGNLTKGWMRTCLAHWLTIMLVDLLQVYAA